MEYIGWYFFVDYCEGIIWIMDFFIGSVYVFFVMGIECFIVLYIVFDGSLYYIECWGFGGGLEIDNISIVNGVFWKVFYIGSGVLFVVV